jgi:hypothetical protein
MKSKILFGGMMLVGACGGGSASNAPQPATPERATESEAPASPSAGGGECEQLATTCHGHDEASSLVAECHMVGHGGDAAACSARHHECMAACEQAAATHPHSGH